MEVDDPVEALARLISNPMRYRAQVVTEGDFTGGLNTREDAGHRCIVGGHRAPRVRFCGGKLASCLSVVAGDVEDEVGGVGGVVEDFHSAGCVEFADDGGGEALVGSEPVD